MPHWDPDQISSDPDPKMSVLWNTVMLGTQESFRFQEKICHQTLQGVGQ